MKNAMSMESERSNKDVYNELAKLDIGRWSILHHLFTRPPIQKITFLKSYLIPWFTIALLFYVIPFLVTWVIEPDILSHKPVGLINDWDTMFMFLITLPILVILTLSQRSMVPKSIASIIQGANAINGKYLSISSFVSSWNKRFKIVNLLGQLAGVLVGMAVFTSNYIKETDLKYNGWQSVDRNVNIAGWIYLCWQLPLFYWITSVFVSQVLVMITLLFRLTRNFKIKVLPFHHDNCCGLKAVGQIGLRNQYLLAVAGINLLALIAVNIKREYSGTTDLTVAAAVAYVTLGPLVFLGPLLPFRKMMLAVKEKEQAKVAKKIQQEYARIMAEDGSITKEKGEMIDTLQKLKTLVDKIPVWPFDTNTLRKFVAAYIFPFLTALPMLIKYASTVLTALKHFLLKGG